MSQIEIHVEYCINCDKHSWCTHHEEKRYKLAYEELKSSLETHIPNLICVANVTQPSIGSFEITYKGIIIYSKKFTGLFPSVGPTTERVKRFLEDVENGQDTSKYAKLPEKKYVAPRKPKEKMTFQTFIKLKEEEEQKKKSSQELHLQQEQQQQQQQQQEQEQSPDQLREQLREHNEEPEK